MGSKNVVAKSVSRGKAIAAHRQKTGDSTDWKKVFAKLDASKKGKL